MVTCFRGRSDVRLLYRELLAKPRSRETSSRVLLQPRRGVEATRRRFLDRFWGAVRGWMYVWSRGNGHFKPEPSQFCGDDLFFHRWTERNLVHGLVGVLK